MNLRYIRKLPDAENLKDKFPLSDNMLKNKLNIDKSLKDIFDSKDKKALIIVGPCSAHDEKAVLLYCEKLAKIQDKLSKKLLIIPRIYTNKPRTNGSGYKGLIHQPDPNKDPNIINGIIAMRKLHINVLKNTGFSTADEMLYPENHEYVNDILSYTAVGARSVENQFHRLTCSGLDMPCGMKNPISGNLMTMLNSIYAARNKHTFMYRGYEVCTNGNKYAHCILRGYNDEYGNYFPNYHYEDVQKLLNLHKVLDISNPSVIIDTNHSNSGKKHLEQIRIIKEILYYKNIYPEIKNFIKGFMIESFLEEGCQQPHENIFGKSITDPCLGFNDTEKLLHYIAEKYD